MQCGVETDDTIGNLPVGEMGYAEMSDAWVSLMRMHISCVESTRQPELGELSFICMHLR